MAESGIYIMTNLQINQSAITYYPFDEAVQVTKVAIDKLLNEAPYILREYTKHLAKSQGKLIRAKGLLVCSMNEKNEVHENAVHLAVAVELLHLATLVHDDVIDDSALRRGQETLQKKFGKKRAVICGDYLLSLALKLTMQLKEKEKYTEFNLPSFVSRVCLGELEQYANNGNLKMSTMRYLKIIRGKTAALFEGAFLAGSIFSGEKTEAQHEYAKLGRYLGMIFQLTDDCIDFEASESQAKKPVGRDFEAGVVTLPLIHALKENKEFKNSIKNGIMDTEELISQVIRFDGLGFTRKISRSYYNKAMGILEKLEISLEKRSMLISVFDKAYNGIAK